MPLIEISLNDSKLIKILELNLLDTILRKEFVDWEYYVLSYFNSVKKYRNSFNKCFSKDMNKRIYKKKIFLDEFNQDKGYSETSYLYSFVHSPNDHINLYYTIK